MSLIAMYAGYCFKCGEWFPASTRVTRVQKNGNWAYAHTPACPESEAEQMLRVNQEALKHPECDVCHTHHPGVC